MEDIVERRLKRFHKDQELSLNSIRVTVTIYFVQGTPKKDKLEGAQKAITNEDVLKLSKEVRVIDDEGKNVGVFPTTKALELSRSKGIDTSNVMKFYLW